MIKFTPLYLDWFIVNVQYNHVKNSKDRPTYETNLESQIECAVLYNLIHTQEILHIFTNIE